MPEDKFGFTPLIEAAIYGDLKTVESLIQEGVKLDTRSREGITALRYAVERHQTDVSLALIKAGANINAKDKRGVSILMEAIKRDQTEVIDVLLEAGVDIHTQTKLCVSRNALTVAAAMGSESVVRKLVALGMDVKANDSESLVRAVCAQNIETAKVLIELGADPDASPDAQGRTLLMTAIYLRNQALVKLLIQAGANINARNYLGQTALDIALEEQDVELVRILTEYCKEN